MSSRRTFLGAVAAGISALPLASREADAASRSEEGAEDPGEKTNQFIIQSEGTFDGLSVASMNFYFPDEPRWEAELTVPTPLLRGYMVLDETAIRQLAAALANDVKGRWFVGGEAEISWGGDGETCQLVVPAQDKGHARRLKIIEESATLTLALTEEARDRLQADLMATLEEPTVPFFQEEVTDE